MKIGLRDVDGHGYPNLALMRLSAFHKSIGDTVEWYLPLERYDLVYASKIFTFTEDDPYLPDNTLRGGSGYDAGIRLPDEVEAVAPDYSIYPNQEAYGFLTRGCPNKCPWCVVPAKEGSLTIYDDIENICNTSTGFRKNVILMDNNFLAAPIEFVKEQTEKMKRLKVKVDFNQSTDARLYDEERAEIMAKIPYLKYARISCDTDAMIPHCITAMARLRQFGWNGDIMVFMLAKNGESESVLHRVHSLCGADKKCVPFIMPYRSLTDNSVVPEKKIKHIARWCNRVWLRKSCSFEEYYNGVK